MRKTAIGLVAVFLLLYILPLGVRPLIIPDETRYAEIPREMLASGDWVVPRLNGIRYFEKPVLGYWLGALAMKVFGENAFAARLPSAVAVGLTSLVVFLLLAGPGGRPGTGLLAAGILYTAAEVFGVGTFNVLDSLLTFCLTAAAAAFLAAFLAERPGRRAAWLALCGGFCGLAFLTKGFLAFAVPALTAATFLLWGRQRRRLLSVPWIPMAAAALVALPWAVAIAKREPDFWRTFFWVEHVQRFFSDAPQHPKPFWYFGPVILGAVLPWTLCLPAAVAGLKKAGMGEPLSRFALCWFVFPLLFFSASSGKLATYILPCLPPLAILIAIGVTRYLEDGGWRLFVPAAAGLACLTGLAALGVVLSPLLPFPKLQLFQPSEAWKPALGAVGLAVWTVFLILSARAHDGGRRMVFFFLGPVLLFFASQFILPKTIELRKAPGVFLEARAAEVGPGATLVADEALAGAVCWFYRRDDVYLLHDGGELNYGLRYSDAARRLLSLERFRILAGASSARSPLILVADARFYRRMEAELPRPDRLESAGRFVMARFEGTVPAPAKPATPLGQPG